MNLIEVISVTNPNMIVDAWNVFIKYKSLLLIGVRNTLDVYKRQELDNGIFYIIYAGSGTQEADGLCKGTSLDAGLFGTTVQSMVDNGHVWYGSTLAELAEATKNLSLIHIYICIRDRLHTI